jgi:hypothetical protein
LETAHKKEFLITDGFVTVGTVYYANCTHGWLL